MQLFYRKKVWKYFESIQSLRVLFYIKAFHLFSNQKKNTEGHFGVQQVKRIV